MSDRIFIHYEPPNEQEVVIKKKPPNGFFLFRIDVKQLMENEYGLKLTMAELSKMAAEMWEKLTCEEKENYRKKYEIIRDLKKNASVERCQDIETEDLNTPGFEGWNNLSEYHQDATAIVTETAIDYSFIDYYRFMQNMTDTTAIDIETAVDHSFIDYYGQYFERR